MLESVHFSIRPTPSRPCQEMELGFWLGKGLGKGLVATSTYSRPIGLHLGHTWTHFMESSGCKQNSLCDVGD